VQKRLIVYELNEVPFRIFDHFARTMPNSAFAKLRRGSCAYETFAEDSGHLSPWITWPTLHRGVTNEDHEISDFGQDLAPVNKEFPPVWELLNRAGVRVGVFGSLHTHPMPKDVSSYAFYVPDTFAAGPECFPKKFEAFQDFNLAMTGNNPSQVNKSIALKEAAAFLRAAPGLGLSGRTVGKVAGQLLFEQINSKRTVRRRTSQVQIAFDFYLKALKADKPDISFFFTNHVASSMHRYWPALFPGDYEALQFDDDWQADWSGEIPFTMRESAHHLGSLMRFVETNPNYMMCVATSMGQAAVQGKERVDRKVIITGLKRLMNKLGVPEDSWEKRPAMVPQYNLQISDEFRDSFKQNIGALTVNGRQIDVKDLGHGVIRIDFSMANQRSLEMEYRGQTVDPARFGFVNVDLQDAAGANAYHIPKGMFLTYDPAQIRGQEARQSISTLEVAPTILRNFGVSVPNYLQTGFAL